MIVAAAMLLAATPAYDTTVTATIQPQTRRLLEELVAHGRGLVLDGTPVFNGADKFLPGKIAVSLVDFLVSLPKDEPRLPEYLADFRKVAALTVDDTNDSWGAYYYLSALNTLRRAGLLKAAIDPLTFAKLRVRLDWRMFVDADTYDLIDHPNNYYCVAFGIARLRTEMGWEGSAPSERLFAKIAEHYRLYSGADGFADETDGEGRFDRYSVLLAGEIAAHFLETGGAPPAEVKGWLRKSADVMLLRMHADGSGFEYGRSLGPYGETAIIEVLTAAAASGVLTDREKALAYAYAARAAKRYATFWVDPRTGSVNLWDGGRRTDAYRGKFRILGENLSLAHQFAYTSAIWDRLGYRGQAPTTGFARALETLPVEATTWFSRGAQDRLLLTRRDLGHVIGLPLISGGVSQHMNTPYFPVPFSRGMLEGVADAEWPSLVPRFTLADGTALMPLAFIREASVTTRGRTTTVRYRQTVMDRMGANKPVADARMGFTTSYAFAPGRITRTDVYTPAGPLDLREIRLELGSFSDQATQRGMATRFGRGALTGFSVEGLDACAAEPLGGNADYRSDTGQMLTRVVCTAGARTLSGPLTIRWTISYKAG